MGKVTPKPAEKEGASVIEIKSIRNESSKNGGGEHKREKQPALKKNAPSTEAATKKTSLGNLDQVTKKKQARGKTFNAPDEGKGGNAKQGRPNIARKKRKKKKPRVKGDSDQRNWWDGRDKKKRIKTSNTTRDAVPGRRDITRGHHRAKPRGGKKKKKRSQTGGVAIVQCRAKQKK